MNNIAQLWPVNLIAEQQAQEATPDFISEILAIGEEYESDYPEAHVPVAMRTNNYKEKTYNLLTDPRPACQTFKRMLKERMTKLITVEGFNNPNTVKFEASTSLRKFGPGEYAKPHNHRSVDYVAVLWLSMEVTDFPGNNTHQKPAGNRLLLIDPIASRSRFLNHNMNFSISPTPGTFIIHPAGIYHTSEINLSNSEPTVALVTNIRIVDVERTYQLLD